jgi:hypothetical protein
MQYQPAGACRDTDLANAIPCCLVVSRLTGRGAVSTQTTSIASRHNRLVDRANEKMRQKRFAKKGNTAGLDRLLVHGLIIDG